MTRPGFALAILLIVYGALLYADIFAQIANDLSRNAVQTDGLASPDNLETAARWGGDAGGGNLVRLYHQISSRLLSSGSEGSL